MQIMKYYLCKEKNDVRIPIFENEIEARKEYLYDVFKLWFNVVKREKDYFILESMPCSTFRDYNIIIGHWNGVVKLLETNELNNKLMS